MGNSTERAIRPASMTGQAMRVAPSPARASVGAGPSSRAARAGRAEGGGLPRLPRHRHLWMLRDGTPAHVPPGRLVMSDDGRLACHLCGRWFTHLGAHLRRHGWTAARYRDAVGLPMHTPLCSEGMSGEIAARQKRTWDASAQARAERNDALAAAQVGTPDIRAWLLPRYERGVTLRGLATEVSRSIPWVRSRLAGTSGRQQAAGGDAGEPDLSLPPESGPQDPPPPSPAPGQISLAWGQSLSYRHSPGARAGRRSEP